MSSKVIIWTSILLAVSGCGKEPATFPAEIDLRIRAIHEHFVFADMHAHPSRFHRADVDTISAEEIENYRSRHMDVIVANISSDMAYSGGYTTRDGDRVERGQYKPAPGETFELAADRLSRLQATFDGGLAVPALAPGDVRLSLRTSFWMQP